MTMHVMFSEFMRQRLCTLCFSNSCAKDYLTAGGCRECHSSAANEDGYDILWYRSGTLDRRTCLIMSFLFRDGMWLTQEPPCWLMIWTWFHLFIKDDGLRNSTRRVQPHRHCSSLPKNQQCVCVCVWYIHPPKLLTNVHQNNLIDTPHPRYGWGGRDRFRLRATWPILFGAIKFGSGKSWSKPQIHTTVMGISGERTCKYRYITTYNSMCVYYISSRITL